ncbi:HD-GYP domain-containing protein [Neobacillus sp. OS1-32]|uniref:HD-GYP domain-containing protein n=1 Tax=Neobacillus paridis TaxID=2803862 RepID=A0ABS1TQW7_9BACI|nr:MULTISPECIES: HD-GYP domain-containing protein [Neobacillus]MBL4953652.1 HD-GYP domain-containing protein [Neobacillus paridis]WML28723.1 HD-GYP domain-containing protein [Neobacillus sp. OS1-32]
MIPHEEKRAIKWFLLFFYIIFIGSDAVYYFILPDYIFHVRSGLPSNIWYLNYALLIILIPVIIYLFKTNNQSLIKYIFFICYVVSAALVDIVTFFGRGDSYTSGNMVEVFLILTLPLFLNISYFWVVSLGIAIKYILIGIVLNTSYVVMPISLLTVLAIMSFFLLIRFRGYVRAVSNSYDEQLDGIVKGVIATLELKDPYTRGHSERVASYALMLLQNIRKFSKKEQKSFYHACLLHDIGKVHIPDSILMKPGKLTEEELDIIKIHPVVGAEAVKNVEGIKDCISVIRSHHERWDGKGYPDGLRGEEIPLLARVAAIADAFDAMTSSRSYRSALPADVAYQRIIEGKGSQFDPVLVESFKNVYPAWVDFHQKYPWN